MYSQTKPLSELSMVDVLNLLESWNLRNYCATFREKKVDGLSLMHCHSVKHCHSELGIVNEAEANRLLNKILEYKELNFRESLTSLTPDD